MPLKSKRKCQILKTGEDCKSFEKHARLASQNNPHSIVVNQDEKATLVRGTCDEA